MPRNRIVLETDAPFAAIGDNPLFPWDIELAAEALCPIWQANLEQVVAQVRANEAALISL
jgi:Tat protein secretion system quality control protein TatD with DNase activity